MAAVGTAVIRLRAFIKRRCALHTLPGAGLKLLALAPTTLLFVHLLTGCDRSTKHRPPGLFKLGLVSELSRKPQTVFPEMKIAVFYDANGFSAMSTACTYDLTPLVRAGEPGHEYWRSMYTTSEYSLDGTVRRGPARGNLPFYDLRVAPGTYGGKPDTLFVTVGVERPRTWRLAVPQLAE